MSWRGQGGRRAKGRRGDQDPEVDNTAWLAELEREAASADDDEDDWADTLRSRRTGGGAPPGPPGPGYPAGPPPAGGPPPGRQPSGPPAFEDAPPAVDPGWAGQDPPGAADRDWVGQDPRDAAADPDWSWRRPALDPYDGAPTGRPEADWSDAGAGGWQPAEADTPTGAWSPATPDPGYAPPDPGYAPPGPDLGYAPPDPGYAPAGPDPGYAPEPAPGYPAASDPGYPDAPLAGREASYPTGYPETPPSEPPVGREPDYPALFGELYRRSAGQQDPIWEVPPPVEALPEAGAADPVTGSWPFEETTQSWEPSDRSFIWPSDELPSAPAEWEQPGPAPWDDPAPEPPPRYEAADRGLDHTAAWPAPAPAPDPAPRPSPWAGRAGTGNGVPPQAPGPEGPPPDDWAAAIPTDVPAAERAGDPSSATRAWRTDDFEPGVPLGPGAAPLGGQLGPGTAVPPGGGAAARTSRLRGGLDPGTRPNGRPDALAADRRTREAAAGAGYGPGAGVADEPGDIRRKESVKRRPAGDRQARAWPRIVAIVSWIVLVMVVCWFYVFPWLERVLPESF